jgi:hypothetical protein
MSDTPQEIAVIAQQFAAQIAGLEALQAQVGAQIAALRALAASLGLPIVSAGGMPGGAVSGAPVGRPVETPRTPREYVDGRPRFQRPRLVQDTPSPEVASAATQDLLDRLEDVCPSGAPTPVAPMTPLDGLRTTGAAPATGDAVNNGAPCA